MEISKRALNELKRQGLSDYALAKYLGIDQSAITNWKKRNSDPKAKHIAPICEFLGVSEHWLLTGEKDKEKEGIDKRLLQLFHSMNDEGKEKALEQLEFFASKYKKHNQNEMVG